MAYSGTDFPSIDPGEIHTIQFDFTAKLVESETVSSITWGACSIGALDPYAVSKLSAQTLVGAVASAKVGGLVGGVKYLFQAEALTSAGNVYSLYSHIMCTNPS